MCVLGLCSWSCSLRMDADSSGSYGKQHPGHSNGLVFVVHMLFLFIASYVQVAFAVFYCGVIEDVAIDDKYVSELFYLDLGMFVFCHNGLVSSVEDEHYGVDLCCDFSEQFLEHVVSFVFGSFRMRAVIKETDFLKSALTNYYRHSEGQTFCDLGVINLYWLRRYRLRCRYYRL